MTKPHPFAPSATEEFLPRPDTPRSIKFELVLVFAITLGASGLRSLIRLIDAALQPVPIASQQVTIVRPQATQSVTDLALQLVSIMVGVGSGGLGLYLLWRSGARISEKLGLDFKKPGRDVLGALALAAAVGLPGIAFYVIAYRLGANLEVLPATLNDAWWTVPVLVLAAFENGFLEEVLVVGYLLTRLRQLQVNPWVALLISALLRGSYHLYQGWGQAVGNMIMGLVFGYAWLRWRRLWPLVVAHTLMDVVAFVGYSTFTDWFNSLLS